MNHRQLCNLSGLLTILLLLFIWGNSLQPASASDALSGGLFQHLQQFWMQVTGTDFPVSHHMLRKAGHFSEFLLLGFFSTFTGITADSHKRRAIFPVLYFGLLSAVLDETLQYFSPGRSPQVTDLLIDHSGFCCGLLLALCVYKKLTAMYQGLTQD